MMETHSHIMGKKKQATHPIAHTYPFSSRTSRSILMQPSKNVNRYTNKNIPGLTRRNAVIGVSREKPVGYEYPG